MKNIDFSKYTDLKVIKVFELECDANNIQAEKIDIKDIKDIENVIYSIYGIDNDNFEFCLKDFSNKIDAENFLKELDHDETKQLILKNSIEDTKKSINETINNLTYFLDSYNSDGYHFIQFLLSQAENYLIEVSNIFGACR